MFSAHDLWRLLNNTDSPLVRESRSERQALTQAVCQQLEGYLDASGNVSAGQVEQITAQLYTSAQQAAQTRPLPRRRFVQRVETILANMNALPGLTIQLPPHSQPLHRPTLAPTSPAEVKRLTALRFVDKQLQAWRRTSRHPDRWLLELATRLACRVGMGPEIIIGSLALLSQARVGTAKQKYILNLPAQPLEPLVSETTGMRAPCKKNSDSSGLAPLPAATGTEKQPILEGSYPLVLPLACRDALAHFRRHAVGNQREWLLLPTPRQPVPTLETRQKHLRERLDRATRELLKDLKKRHPEARETLRHLTSWHSIARTGPLLAQRKGVPAIWLQVLARYPLPTCTPEPMVRDDNPRQLKPTHGNGIPPPASSAGSATGIETHDRHVTTPGVQEPNMMLLTPEQAAALRQVMQKFLVEISMLTTTARLSSQSLREPLEACKMRAIDKLSHISGNETSFYHLLLHFAFSRLWEHENTVSTVTTYLRRLTPSPIRFHEAIADVGAWDQDTLDELCHEALHYSSWDAGTQQHFLVTLRLFVRFCQQHDFLEEASLPSMARVDRVSTLRTAVSNPGMVENAWGSLIGQTSPSQTRQQYALALALGFYGGLRASEVCQLTLADIRIEERESADWGEWSALHACYGQGALEKRSVPDIPVYCWVYIRRGKTAAARRRIPLHVLAPPAVIAQMRQWCDTRRQVTPTLTLRDIALFGPLFSPMAYTRQGLIDPLLAWLRNQWQCQIDFHGLRHAAVSWLQLRIHAAQYPTFRDTLLHRSHWMFSPQALDTLYSYLCAAEGKHSVEQGNLMGQVAKIIGHRYIATLVQVYSHTLNIIHADVLQRSWSQKNRTG